MLGTNLQGNIVDGGELGQFSPLTPWEEVIGSSMGLVVPSVKEPSYYEHNELKVQL